MERNWDMIRNLLIQVEELSEPDMQLTPTQGDWVEAEHMALLCEAGYCGGSITRMEGGSPIVHLSRLTWQGYDLLDSIRNDTVWKKMTTRMANVGGKVSVEMLKQLAAYVVKEALDLK